MRMKHIFSLLSLFFLVISISSYGSHRTYESVEGDPMNARIYTLDNGLKVYMAVNKEEPRIQTYIAVRVGGKDDPSTNTGLAHYFEHLMFKGSMLFGTSDYAAEKVLLDQIEAKFEQYRNTTDDAERAAIYKDIDSLSYDASKIAIPNEYDKLMSAIGASGTNAYTSNDVTVYVENIPSNQVENWAKIQADRIENNIIRGFHTELETVYEEKNRSLTSDGRKAVEATFAAIFPDHPYGTQTVLGTQEHLKNPSITAIKNFHKKWYVPNNMAVCLSGDFDPDEMITIIDRYFGQMKPNKDIVHIVPNEANPLTAPVESTVLGNDAEFLVMAWRTGSETSVDADKLNILSSVLYNGKAGLLDLDLNQQQRVMGAYAFYYGLVDHGMMFLQAMPKPGQTLDDLKALLLEEVGKLKSGDFDEALLESTINNYVAMQMSMIDSNNSRANLFVEAFGNNEPWADVVGMVDRMRKITKDDIVELANRIFEDNYAAVYKRQGTDPAEVKMDKPAITPIFMNRDASSDFLFDIQRSSAAVEPIKPVFLDFDKDVTKLTAKSKIPVLYAKNKTNGLFQLTYVYEIGSNNDPATSLAFDYLDYLGTKDMTPEQVKQEFYRIACSFRVSTATERCYIVISGLSDNMDRAITLMESLMKDARANDVALADLKGRILKSREDAKLNHSANFSRLRNFATYGPNSPATNILSTEELNAVSSKELIGKIHNLLSMEHQILYYGPLSEGDAISMINKNHNAAKKLKPVPVPVKFPMLETDQDRVLLVQYDAKQAMFAQYSNRGELYDVSNDAGAELYNSYFGGGMSSIVFQEMREARALAYAVGAYLTSPNRLDKPYTMQAVIGTQSDKLIQAIDVFQDIINNMPESEAAFEIAKESIISQINSQRYIKDYVIWVYVNAQDLKIDYDRRKDLYEQVQKMTLADVKEFQQKWVKDRKYTFVVLGNLEDLDVDKLAEYGPTTIVSQEEIFGY